MVKTSTKASKKYVPQVHVHLRYDGRYAVNCDSLNALEYGMARKLAKVIAETLGTMEGKDTGDTFD